MCNLTVTIFISLGYCVFISQGIISMTYIVQVGVRKVAACFLNFHVLVPTIFGQKTPPRLFGNGKRAQTSNCSVFRTTYTKLVSNIGMQ